MAAYDEAIANEYLNIKVKAMLDDLEVELASSQANFYQTQANFYNRLEEVDTRQNELSRRQGEIVEILKILTQRRDSE